MTMSGAENSGIRFLLCAFAAAILFYAAKTLAADTLQFATLDWEPYIGETLPDNGYVAVLVHEAFDFSDRQVELTFLPWARVVAIAKTGEFDGYLPEYHSKELEKDFIFSDPFPGGPLGFFRRKGSNIHYSALRDLSPFVIGVVRGYVNTVEFDTASYLKKEEVSNDLLNFKKLLNKRVDLVVADKYVGHHIMNKYLQERQHEIEFISPPLEEKLLYLCISRKKKDAEKIVATFNDGLRNMQETGRLEEILRKYGFAKAAGK